MVDITIVNRGYFMVYKPTNITGGPHPAPFSSTRMPHRAPRDQLGTTHMHRPKAVSCAAVLWQSGRCVRTQVRVIERPYSIFCHGKSLRNGSRQWVYRIISWFCPFKIPTFMGQIQLATMEFSGDTRQVFRHTKFKSISAQGSANNEDS